MKPLEKRQTLKTSGIQKSVSFGIKQSGIHHVLGILRDQLYSDKVLAIIREYSTNAVDAHIEAGNADRPIEVTFPTKLKPVFKVRDFGDGLTEQEIQDVYAFYGESTKRNSNDCTGMLGIGSKSAFSYGDNFVINSFVKGKKITYNAFIDPSQVGQISKLSEEDTDEEDGIEISVPVREDDCQEFLDKGKTLFEWFSVRPNVKGCNPFEYKDSKVLFSGDNWEWRDVVSDRYHSYRSRHGELTVVMGNIGYPVDSSDLNLSYDDKISHLVSENLVLRVPIGDVEISASREKLQFTDYTRKKLKMHLQTVREELSSTISKQFKVCNTLFEAKCLYGSTFRTDSPLYALRDVIKDHLVWNGKTVDGDSYNTYGTGGATTVRFKKSYRGERYKSDECGSFSCDKNLVLIENDIGHRRGMMGRILPIIHNQKKTPVMLEFQSFSDGDKIIKADKVRANWIKKEKFDGTLVKLSELPKHKMSEFVGYQRSASTTSGGVKNGKHSAKLFELDIVTERRGWHSPKSDFWNIAEVDMDNGGVFVIIDKFNALRGLSDECASQLINKVKDLKAIGVKVPKVYAVKIKQRSQLEGKKGWQNFYDFAKEKTLEKLNEGSLTQSYVDYKSATDFTGNREDAWGSYKSEALEMLLKGLPQLADKEGTIATFLTNYQLMKSANGKAKQLQKLVEVANEYTDIKKLKIKPTYDLKQEFKTVIEKYSMLKHLDSHGWRWNNTKEIQSDVINYINVIDLCNKS